MVYLQEKEGWICINMLCILQYSKPRKESNFQLKKWKYLKSDDFEVHMCYVISSESPEDKFLDVIGTKVLRVFLRTVPYTSGLYPPLSLPPWAKAGWNWFICKHCIWKPQTWELSRLYPETSKKLYIHIPKPSFSISKFWACFRENWVYKFRHRCVMYCLVHRGTYFLRDETGLVCLPVVCPSSILRIL